jgi:SAM-dependent methyltransferase
MAVQLFDDLTEIYDAMIDWPKRLAYEEPFYRRLFQRVAARRIVDVACGTGRHAAMFHGWGLEVEGADVSRNMIDRARQNHGESETLRWVVRGFDEPVQPTGSFDVALCVGNSLALAADSATASRAIHAMVAAVRPGGVVVVHVVNLWRLPDGPCLWQKCKRAELDQGEVLIVKGIHRSGLRGFVDLVVIRLADTCMQSDTAMLLGLEAEELQQTARDAGATSVELFGGYRDEPYVRTGSGDLVIVAQK